MNANEIRQAAEELNQKAQAAKTPADWQTIQIAVPVMQTMAMLEIAAQLAELNANDRKRVELLEESNGFQRGTFIEYVDTQKAIRERLKERP